MNRDSLITQLLALAESTTFPGEASAARIAAEKLLEAGQHSPQAPTRKHPGIRALLSTSGAQVKP